MVAAGGTSVEGMGRAAGALAALLGEPWERGEGFALWQCLSARLERFPLRLERRESDGLPCVRLPWGAGGAAGKGLGDLGHVKFVCLDSPATLERLVRQLREEGVRPAPRGYSPRPGRHEEEREPEQGEVIPDERRFHPPPHPPAARGPGR